VISSRRSAAPAVTCSATTRQTACHVLSQQSRVECFLFGLFFVQVVQLAPGVTQIPSTVSRFPVSWFFSASNAPISVSADLKPFLVKLRFQLADLFSDSSALDRRSANSDRASSTASSRSSRFTRLFLVSDVRFVPSFVSSCVSFYRVKLRIKITVRRDLLVRSATSVSNSPNTLPNRL